MDKDLLRIVIIVVGAIVVSGMLLRSVLKNKKKTRKIKFNIDRDVFDPVDESLIIDMDDDVEIVHLGSVDDTNIHFNTEVNVVPEAETPAAPDVKEEVTAESKRSNHAQDDLPKIIQLSIVARSETGFLGTDLVEAFEKVGLEYGSNRIYERLDKERQVDFAVASLVEPGTFPDHDLSSFYCPGIVFFMQPRQVNQPLDVYEDLIRIINLLSTELSGVAMDSQRKPLTDEYIDTFRQSLLN